MMYIGFNKGDKAMNQSVLTIPRLQNEEAAYAYIEARLWPKGPICPHCGSTERISKMKGNATGSAFISATPAGNSLPSKSGLSSRIAISRFESGSRQFIYFVAQKKGLAPANFTEL